MSFSVFEAVTIRASGNCFRRKVRLQAHLFATLDLCIAADRLTARFLPPSMNRSASLCGTVMKSLFSKLCVPRRFPAGARPRPALIDSMVSSYKASTHLELFAHHARAAIHLPDAPNDIVLVLCHRP